MYKRIIKIVLSTLSILLFGLAVYIMAFGALAIKNNKLINIFGYSYSLVPTNSMETSDPKSIKEGDFIFIKIKDFEDVNVGDIVVYKTSQGVMFVHRVHEEGPNNSFYMRGDKINLDESIPDEFKNDVDLLTESNYQGHVIGRVGFINISKGLSKHRTTLIAAIIGILLLFVVIQAVQIIRSVQKHKLEQLREQLEKDQQEEHKDLEN